jgi:hypothetical protein
VRGRVENILDYASVKKYRSGDNPARWAGHLRHLLAAKEDVHTVQTSCRVAVRRNTRVDSQAAREHQHGGACVGVACLDGNPQPGRSWRAVGRDQGRVLAIPPQRMKREREHRVPLSDAALGVLDKMRPERRSDPMFAGQADNKPICDKAIVKLLMRMGYGHVTLLGFRSAFKCWAIEQTEFAYEVSEMAFAHAVGDKVEEAYRRGDLREKRARLMQTWAKHCGGKSAGAAAHDPERRFATVNDVLRKAPVPLAVGRLTQSA